MDVSETTCRICFKPGNLITPCFCRGVFAFAHQSCLNNWLEETKSEYCDICRFKYKTIKYPRNFFDWVMMEAKGRVDLIITIGVHFFLFYFFLFGGFIWFNSLDWIRNNFKITVLNNPDYTSEPPTPPKRVVRSSGVSKGSLKLNYKSSLSSDSF